MSRFAFVGPSYASQSLNADAQVCQNWYPENDESGQGKSAVMLYPSPGTKIFSQLSLGQPNGGVRNGIQINGRVFFVCAGTLWELFSNGSKKPRGVLVNNVTSIAYSTTQIFLAAGGIAYCYDLNANQLAPVVALAGITISQVGYGDGFFIALQANSQIFYVSATLDCTSWNLANFGQVSVFPDNVTALLVDHRELWLWGPTKAIVYYDSGDPLFPYSPVPGSFIEQGIVAPSSAVRLDNSLFWLGSDDRGGGIAWRAQGYTPQRVSNHAIEYEWSTYATIADAISYAYQDQGHSFWVIYFPTASKTWVYDVATGMWHERGFFEGNGVFTAHRSQCHVYAFGKHLVGDWNSGNIYQMAIPSLSNDGVWSFADDNGNPIRRVRRAPHISKEQQWGFHSKLQIDVEVGLGPAIALTGTKPTTTFILKDANNVLWQLTVNDDGTLQTSVVAAGAVNALNFNDSANGSTSWSLGVTIGGLLMTTAIAFNAAYPQLQAMVSNSGQYIFNLQISQAGLIQTVGRQPASPRGPQMYLRWSDDAGKTWSNERILDCGQSGEFKKRVIARRLGRSRDRIYEIAVTDPIGWRIVDAYLEATDFAPQERLVKELSKRA